LSKVILVLSDGLRYDTAVAGMGYLGHLVEAKLASLYKLTGELPSISRPMYETIHTGLPVSVHGIVSNQVVRTSLQPNIFRLARDAGRVTAAAAYCWFSELYNRSPYDRIEDCEVDDPSLPIQHGRFYTRDDFPDIDLFAIAGMLVRRFSPDYLLVHPMGMDYIGGIHGADSSAYRNHAVHQDMALSTYLNAASRSCSPPTTA
jgi:predicted AlkP superfamily pyrophosphatase or phosphodiesterase